jgi:hypothetical protein
VEAAAVREPLSQDIKRLPQNHIPHFEFDGIDPKQLYF